MHFVLLKDIQLAKVVTFNKVRSYVNLKKRVGKDYFIRSKITILSHTVFKTVILLQKQTILTDPVNPGMF